MPNPLDTLYDQLKGQYPDLVDRSEFIGKLSNEEELKKLHDAASKDIPGFVDFDNFKSKVGESLSTYDQDSDYKTQNTASTGQENAETVNPPSQQEESQQAPSEPQNSGIESEASVPDGSIDTSADAEAFDRETGDLDELGRRYDDKVKRLEGYGATEGLYANEEAARKHYEAYSRLLDEAEQDRLVYNRRVKAAEDERAEQQRQLDLQSKDRKTRRSAEYGGYTNDQVRKEQERLKKERAYLEDPKSKRNADYSRRVMEYNADQTALSAEADKRNKSYERKRAMYDEVKTIAEDPDVQKRITGNDTVAYVLSGNNPYALQSVNRMAERAKTMTDEELFDTCKTIAWQKYARGYDRDIYAPLAGSFLACYNELMYRMGGDEPKSAIEMRYDMIDKATEGTPEGDRFMLSLRNYLDGTAGMGTANYETDDSERANIPQFAIADIYDNLVFEKDQENMRKVEQRSRYPLNNGGELDIIAAATDINYDEMLQKAYDKFGEEKLRAYIVAHALHNGISIDESAQRVNQSIWNATIGKEIEGYRPKSNFEFFVRRIFSDNMFSKLMQLGIRGRNGNMGGTDPFALNTMVLDEYAKEHPGWDTAAVVTNFAVMEGPIFSAYGKLASGLVGATERAVLGAALKTTDRVAIEATARTLSQSLVYRLAKGGATGALVGFQYGTMSGTIDQAYYNGNVDFGKVIVNGGHTMRDFALMHGVGELFGVTGDAILRRGQRNLRNGQGALRNRIETTSLHFLNNVAKTTTNAGIVTGLYAAIDKPAIERENKKIEAENKKIEAENARLPEDQQKPLKPLNQIASVEDTFYSSLRMFAGLDAVGMLRSAWSIGVRGQYERNKHVKVHFDKFDREALEKAFGKNPNSLLRQIVFGNVDGVPAKWFEIDPEAEQEIYRELGRELTPAEKEAYATYGFTELRKIILNKDIPWATRAKIVSVVTGRIVQEPPVAKATIDFVMDSSGTRAKRIIVKSLDLEGNVIQIREFDGQREFEAARSLYEAINDRGWRNNAMLCGDLVIDAIEDKTYADTVDEMAREKGISSEQFEQMVFGIKQKDITGEKVTYQERQLVDEFDKRHQEKQDAETKLTGPDKLFEQIAREVFGAEWKQAKNIPFKSWGEMTEAEKEFVNKYIERMGAMGVAERNKLMNANPDWVRTAKEYEESVRRRMEEAERPAESEPLPALEDEKVSVEVPAEERVEPVPEVIELEEEPGKEQPTQSAGPQDTPALVEERPTEPAEPAAEEKPATVEPEQPMTEEKPQQAGTIGFEPVEQPTERERYDAERKAKAATITDADIEANREALGIPEGTALTDETRQIYAEDLAEDLMRYERFKRGESDEKARFHDYWESKFNPKEPKAEPLSEERLDAWKKESHRREKEGQKGALVLSNPSEEELNGALDSIDKELEKQLGLQQQMEPGSREYQEKDIEIEGLRGRKEALTEYLEETRQAKSQQAASPKQESEQPVEEKPAEKKAGKSRKSKKEQAQSESIEKADRVRNAVAKVRGREWTGDDPDIKELKEAVASLSVEGAMQLTSEERMEILTEVAKTDWRLKGIDKVSVKEPGGYEGFSGTDAIRKAERRYLREKQIEKLNKDIESPKKPKPAKIEDFADKDKDRLKDHPQFGGVYHDTDGTVVATDGFTLVAVKGADKKRKEGVIIGKDGKPIEGRYPNYKSVFPDEKAERTASVKVVWRSVRNAVSRMRSLIKLAEKEREWDMSNYFPEYETARVNGDTVVAITIGDKHKGTIKLSNLDKFASAADTFGIETLETFGNGRAMVARNDKASVLTMPLVETKSKEVRFELVYQEDGTFKLVDRHKERVEKGRKSSGRGGNKDDDTSFSLLSLNYRDGEAEEGTIRSRARTRKQIGTIAKALGYKIRWVADKPYNAKIDTDEKVLYLNIRTDQPLAAVMGHEVTHDLRKSDPEAYETLKRYAQDLLGQEQWDNEVKGVTKDYNKEYERRGWQPIRADKAEEEVVCDTMGKVLHSRKGLRELAGRLDPGVAGKVYRLMKDIVDKVKSALGKEHDYSTMDLALRDFLNAVEQRAKKDIPIQDAPIEDDFDIDFSLRRKPAPKNTGVGYKVFFLKDGKLYPPMVANIGGEATPFGVWLDADAAPIAGKSKTGRNKVKAGGKGTQGGSGTLAYRPGWHLGKIPYALQFNRGKKVPNPLGILNKKGQVIEVGEFFPNDFVWAEVEYAADKDYQEEAHGYGVNANGKYNPSLAGLPRVPEDGSYEYRTNPNPATDPWIITGAMKVNRILKPSEVDAMVRAAGREPQKRQEGAFTDEQIDALNKQLNSQATDAQQGIHRDHSGGYSVTDKADIESMAPRMEGESEAAYSERIGEIEADEKAFVDGDGQFSLKKEDDMRDNSVKYFEEYHVRGNKDRKYGPLRRNSITRQALDKANEMIAEMRDYIAPWYNREAGGNRYLPEEVYGLSTIFDNASYGATLENTLICTRTLAYNDFCDSVKRKLGRPLTKRESFLASQMLYDIATDPQCLYCYVSLDRKAYDEYLLRYFDERDAVIERYNKMGDKSAENIDALYKTFLDGRKDTYQMRSRFNSWLQLADHDSAIGRDKVALSSDRKNALAQESDEEAAMRWRDITKQYNRLRGEEKKQFKQSKEYLDALHAYLATEQGQIKDACAYAQGASWAKKEAEYRSYTGELLRTTKRMLGGLASHYGLRFYSFSEYSPAFILENMQMVRDAALRGLKGFAYTKEIDFCKIFLPTGININCSTYGRRNAAGEIVMDERQGANWDEARALRDQYENMGIVFVATDDEMVRWAKEQPWIDVIIPFHIVRTGADIAEFYGWTNYTNVSADYDAQGRHKDIMPPEHNNSIEDYDRLIAERGLTRRFPQFYDGPGDQNYMKLINETRRKASDTPILTPVFNMEEAKKSFDKFVEKGGYWGGFYEVGADDVVRAVDEVAADIEAGKSAGEVEYGRQDIDFDSAMANLEKTRRRINRNREHGNTPKTSFSLKRETHTDANGNEVYTETREDGTKDREITTYGDGSKKALWYDDKGNLKERLDYYPNGEVSQVANYDSDGNLTRNIQYDENRRTTSYYLPAIGTDWKLDENGIARGKSNGVEIKPYNFQFSLKREQTHSENFKRWFGDWENDPDEASKVVDEEGKPLVMYHTTTNEFTVFDKNRIGTSGHGHYIGFGFNFASHQTEYGPNVMKVYLDAKHPLRMDTRTLSEEQVVDILKGLGYRFARPSNTKSYDEQLREYVHNELRYYGGSDTEIYQWISNFSFDAKDVIDAFKDLGFDSSINYGFDGKISTVVVFDPEQIKSATDNNGDFSRENPDIRFSLKRRRNRDDYTDEDRADAAIIANTYLAQADALRQQIEADREREHQLVEERNRLLAFDYPAADPADRPAIMDRINALRNQINDLRNANYENNTKLRSMDYEYRVAKEILEQGAVTDEEAARFDAGQMTREEKVLESLFKAAADSRADKKAKQKAIRGLVRELAAITDNFKAAMKARGIESQRKHYDKGTVDHIIRLARAMMRTGYIDNMTSYEVKRLMGMINNAATRESIETQAGRIVDMMLDHQIRTLRKDFDKQLKVTGQKTNSSGVQVQAGLDQEGQVVMEAMRKSMQIIADSAGERYDSNGNITEWGEFYEKTLNDMGDEDPVKAEQARKIFEGVWLASKWYEDVRTMEINGRILRSQMEDFKASNKPAKDADKDTKQRYNDVLADYQEMLRQNKIKIIEAYERMTGDVGMTQAESVRRAKEFADEQKQRVNEIQHNANSDLADVDDNTQVETPESRVFGANKNNVLARLLFASAGTYEKFMRFFGRMAPNGEGYLFKRFMTQYHHARQDYWKGRHSAFEEMDKKMAEVFGKKKMHWSDIYEMTRDHKKFPPITVSYWDGYRNGQPYVRVDELNQSEALYLYMINKMPDGRMKLRKMGITDDKVQQMAGEIDGRLIQLADWLQSEFLPKMRVKYNETHKRVFGADMAAIEDYFPLRINKLAVASDMDITERDMNDNKPSTITGAIVKRRVNTLPIDLHTDAFDVALSHIDEMEHWSAFAEFNRDNNTLVNYKRFRTKVNNMRSLELGAGDVLWKNFTDAVAIAADAYHPRAGSRSGDHYSTRVAKFVSTAKIALRPYTALKQLLSIPAFWADSDPLEQFKATVDVANTWQWAIENLPGFAERWQSRQAGNIKLANYNDLSGLRRRKVMRKLQRAGMWANAAIDGLACAMGGKAVYETKLKRYRKMGYDEARAQEKALIDAAIAYNNSQQSSEGAYVSPLQVDRTWFANAFSVFRSASMGYTRRFNTALRQLRNATFKPGYGAKSVEFLKKQMIRDGLTEEQAEKWAHRIYRRANLKAAASVAIFGQILPFAWNLGTNMFYLLFGDDDKEKKKILADSFRHSFFGPIEGLVGGNVYSELGDIAADTAIGNIWGDSIWGDSNAFKALGYRDFSTMPLSSDLNNVLKYFARDEVKAANEVVNILFQVATGVNPQTITDWVTAILDFSRSDMERRDIAMFAMRMLSTPQQQLDKFYLDQMNLTQEQAAKMSKEDLIKRYATYKRWRETPLTGWMYSDEREKKVEEKFQKRYEEMLEERAVAEEGLRGTINKMTDLPRKRTMMDKLQKELTDSIEATDPELYKKALEGEKADDDEYVRRVTDKDVELMAELQMKKKALKEAHDRKTKADKDFLAYKISVDEYHKICDEVALDWKLYNMMGTGLSNKINEMKDTMEQSDSELTPEEAMDSIRTLYRDALNWTQDDAKKQLKKDKDKYKKRKKK